MDTERVKYLRKLLGMSVAEYSDLLAVAEKTVRRWEGDPETYYRASTPTSTPEAVLLAIEEYVRLYPDRAEEMLSFINTTSKVGGLTYLLLRLLEVRHEARETLGNCTQVH